MTTLHLTSLLTLFASTFFIAASLPASPGLYGNNHLVHQALTTLLSGPLSGQDLLLVTDDHTQRLLDLNQVMEAAGASLTPVFLATQHSLLHTPRPAHHTKGTLLTALLLFYQDPTDFLLLLADNTNWNPSYLVLFCLNPNLNTTTVLSQPVVQRSHFIHLLQIEVREDRHFLYTYTSLPMQVSGRGRPLTKATMGLWTQHKFSTRDSLFPSRFNNFGNETLQVSMLPYDEPFVYFDLDGNCIGMNIDALQIIGKKLNFQFSVSSPDSIIWGYKENGTWKGMLGQLMYEGNDLVVNVLQPNPERLREFDFTYPYWDDSFAFLLRVPPPLPQWRNILYPFSSLVWGVVIATLLIIPTLLVLLLRFINDLHDPIGLSFKVMGGMLNQSVSVREVQAWWAKVWLMFWWLAIQTILCPVYQGNLVAVLTVPVFPPLLRTIQDVVDSNLIPSMNDYGSFVPEALKTSKNPTLATLGERLNLEGAVATENPLEIVFRQAMEGTYIIIVTVDYLIFYQHKSGLTHSTYIMEDKIYKSYMSWFLPLHTPYTTIISHHLSRLLETGVLAALYKQHMGSRVVADNTQVRGDGVLNLSHLQGAFILLVLGLDVAFIVLLLERLTNKTPPSPPP
ncbi:hypothetical protein Pmani_033650 [Petrolisthes manimaculis]|uniref:Ionotropic glutamate receptor L-glutamate and glycine-binding domain-containing protein n=1 Tax=Petrolisthes manimaculis TaxID=1843537 RepID=A0AAE1TSE5_9EUCA|nr:hypothetical protein Pmani_033650 [Petrolisthes manimaculis]